MSTHPPAPAPSRELRSGVDLDEDRLYRSLWPEIARLAYLLSGSETVAEDLAQEAFIGLFRAQNVGDARAYLRRSVANLATNAGKRSRREHAYLRTVPQRSYVGSDAESDDLWPLLDRLPSRQRAVIVLRYYLDWSEAEIARALNCRPGTVKAHASRALNRLRKELS